MMKKIIFSLLLLCGALSAFGKTATLYHTSDTHGFFYPQAGRGGAAALAAVLASGPKEYLLLDSGDFAEGTVETQQSNGLKAIWLMNRLGYHAATIGNHEFAFKDNGFDNLAAAARFPLLAANIQPKEGGKSAGGVVFLSNFYRWRHSDCCYRLSQPKSHQTQSKISIYQAASRVGKSIERSRQTTPGRRGGVGARFLGRRPARFS